MYLLFDLCMVEGQTDGIRPSFHDFIHKRPTASTAKDTAAPQSSTKKPLTEFIELT